MKQDSKIMTDQDVKDVKDVEAVMRENFYYLHHLTEKIAHRIEVELDGEVKGYEQIIAILAVALERISYLTLSYNPSRPKSEDCGECEGKG